MQRPADDTRAGLPIKQKGGKGLEERCDVSYKEMFFFGLTAIFVPESVVDYRGDGNEDLKTDINATVTFSGHQIRCVQATRW